MIHLSANTITSKEVKAVLTELDSRVMAVSQMYDLLNSSNSITTVRLDEYIDRVASLIPGMSGNIAFKKKYDALITPVKATIPIGIIVVELITNSIKYAFPDNRKGTISLSLIKTDAGALIEISDDGIGLPAGFDLSAVDSLGLELVQAMTSQIEGTFTLEGGDGTRCVVEFPI